MRWITSANIACGGHAGDAASMARCCRLAAEFGVRLGAHPGLANRADFGRGPARVTPGELAGLLREQVGALVTTAQDHGLPLHHIKLHGALYHAVERDKDLAHAYLAIVKQAWPRTKIYALAGGTVVQAAGKSKPLVWGEAFADRAYEENGQLVPRSEPGALIEDAPVVRTRAWALAHQKPWRTQAGTPFHPRARTLCVHGDTPQAARLARAAAEGAGLVTSPPRPPRPGQEPK